MALCRTCHTDDARPTKTECWSCYRWRRDKKHDGQARPEDVILKNNQRRFEKELLRKRLLS